jgi:hypothetical protein
MASQCREYLEDAKSRKPILEIELDWRFQVGVPCCKPGGLQQYPGPPLARRFGSGISYDTRRAQCGHDMLGSNGAPAALTLVSDMLGLFSKYKVKLPRLQVKQGGRRASPRPTTAAWALGGAPESFENDALLQPLAEYEPVRLLPDGGGTAASTRSKVWESTCFESGGSMAALVPRYLGLPGQFISRARGAYYCLFGIPEPGTLMFAKPSMSPTHSGFLGNDEGGATMRCDRPSGCSN